MTADGQREFFIELSTPRGRELVEVVAASAPEARRLALGPKRAGGPVVVSVTSRTHTTPPARRPRTVPVAPAPAAEPDALRREAGASAWLAALLAETGLTRRELAELARAHARGQVPAPQAVGE